MLAKAVLHVPKQGQKRHVVKDILLSYLKRWKQGALRSLWQEAGLEALPCMSSSTSPCSSNVCHSVKLTMEGRYGDATIALRSRDVLPLMTLFAFAELTLCHPEQDWQNGLLKFLRL